MANYSLMPEDKVLSDLSTDLALTESVNKKKKSIEERQMDLDEASFKYAKDRNAQMDKMAGQRQQSQEILGGMSSMAQTMQSATNEDALMGSAMSGVQLGMATGSVGVGVAAAGISYLMSRRKIRQAKKEAEKAAAEAKAKEKKKNLMNALSRQGDSRSNAMTNLMNVFR